MFTAPAIARLARHASALVEGEGQGHTEYRTDRAMGRYVVGGMAPAALLPVGVPRAVVRATVRRMLDAASEAGVETLGVWEDDGTVYVDLGDTWTVRARALAAARVRGELAIYDRETGECIPVPPAFGALAR
ncbi:hypothetical protein SEA_ALLEB_7 [Microbacterium phage Alleb]|nr:hypothetical protein SEA_ALLEB_115 [Microbacterium phage Alleb]QAU07447.1 hypothetical protein SEA_ALLEB_7 [Microbacterium phage Alleb]